MAAPPAISISTVSRFVNILIAITLANSSFERSLLRESQSANSSCEVCVWVCVCVWACVCGGGVVDF